MSRPDPKVIFIVGGARSGKSAFALKLARETKSSRVVFVATCQPLDEEMKCRIARHKKNRPASWKTIVAPSDIYPVVKKIAPEAGVIIIDCLTLMVSNLMLQGKTEKYILDTFNSVLGVLKRSKALSIIVSNEVGLGIVPDNALARDFRDRAGRLNQIAAQNADEVYFMVSGMPLRIK